MVEVSGAESKGEPDTKIMVDLKQNETKKGDNKKPKGESKAGCAMETEKGT